MKRMLLALLLLPSLCLGAANDFGMSQRSPADNSWVMRLMASPATPGVMVYDPATKLTVWNTLGSGLAVSGGVLSATGGAAVTWSTLSGKPNFSPVSLSGDYVDLVNKPNLFSGFYSDLSGKPSLFSGNYADLLGLPVLFSGAYADLSGKPSLFSGSYLDLANKPTIPAAQVATDWSAATGVSAILNKPVLFSGAYADLSGKPSLFSGSYTDLTNKPNIPAAQVQSDWTAASGAAAILNKPTLFTGAYADLTGKPTIPAAQVNSDWNAVFGAAQILNKPSTFPPSAHTQAFSTITNTPTTLAGYGITDAPPTPVPSTILRTLNSAYQISATRPALVSYNVDISVVSLLLAGTQGTVTLQYADTAAMSNPVTVASATNSTGGVLNVANVGTAALVGFVPAGKYVRIVTANTSGTPTFTFRNGQETIF